MLSTGPDRDDDDDPQADVQHDRRRNHPIGVPVGQVEEARQIESAPESIEYAAEHRQQRTVQVEEVEPSERIREFARWLKRGGVEPSVQRRTGRGRRDRLPGYEAGIVARSPRRKCGMASAKKTTGVG
jgi:hypothetical protein